VSTENTTSSKALRVARTIGNPPRRSSASPEVSPPQQALCLFVNDIPTV